MKQRACHFFCRIYQRLFYLGLYLLPWRTPELLEGEGCVTRLPQLLKREGLDRVLIVTDRVVTSLGLMDSLTDQLKREKIGFIIYDGTVANPTADNVEEAFRLYKKNCCKGIIAFGGGSPIDCAKGVGMRAARPDRSLAQLKGVLKVHKRLPPLAAVPTTAGTGSEATLAAVICDPAAHEKYAVSDTVLIPRFAVLDPCLTAGLPPHITASTGVDALTHAVEAYIGGSNTRRTGELAAEAVRLVFGNLRRAVTDGKNLEARKNMLAASHCAGRAFTRAFVGYVHAMAHTLGGFYGLPHGLANAVVLPYVLEAYGKAAHRRLGELACLTGAADPQDTAGEKAEKFIQAVRALNRDIGIPAHLEGIRTEDIPEMARRAQKEAVPLYPVPRILSGKELERLFRLVGGQQETHEKTSEFQKTNGYKTGQREPLGI